MRSSRTAVAWIFERLGLDVALAGDLMEEYARGRSTLWYWRQVLAAIWTGIWGAIFHHKLLAVRAVVTGCAVNGVWLFLWLNFLHLRLTVMPPDTRPLLMEVDRLLVSPPVHANGHGLDRSPDASPARDSHGLGVCGVAGGLVPG